MPEMPHWGGVLRGFIQVSANGLRRIPLLRLYEKASSASQSPQHEATHGSVHERLAGFTQLLVVFAHPPVVADPGKGAFHHPAAWEDLKCPRWQKLLPINYLAFLGQLLRPPHQHIFGGGFTRTFDQFHTPS